MKLYYSKGACSLVPRIIINEIGLRCDFESVNLKTKETEKGRDFYQINPKGSVPVLEFNNKEVLTENAVILQFLADDSKSSQLLPEVGNFQRYRVLEWLNYITTELHKSFSPLFNPSVADDLKKTLFIPLLKTKLSFVNTHLTQSYLVGNQFTLADAYLFVVLRWTQIVKINLAEWDNLQRFMSVLKQRPSIAKALEMEGLTA